MTLLYGSDGKPVSGSASVPHKTSGHHTGIRARRAISWILGIATTIIGVVAVVYPRPVVTPSEPVDPENSLSASFTVTNNNVVPLWHVSGAFSLGELHTAHREPPTDSTDPAKPPRISINPAITLVSAAKFGSDLSMPSWLNHKLNMDDGFTVIPEELFDGKFTDG
jgi:hypothetical protein